MAKKDEKKPQKSGKTDPPKSSDAGKKPKKGGKAGTGKKSKKAAPAKTAAKKAPIRCQFCEKPMKDEKTRKIHERNCKAKSGDAQSPKQKDMESALLELKDRFEDQNRLMADNFREKEDHLQRELEEVKTVLRLEIDRHRKELERIRKVEREVGENHIAPGQTPEAPEPLPEAPEPHRVRSQQPRAIDMVPMRVPHIPKRKPEPDGDIPDIDEEPAPPEPRIPGLDRAMVEEIARNVFEQSVPRAAEPADTGDMAGKLDNMARRLDNLDERLERNMAALRKATEKTGHDPEIKRFEKELDKLSEKVLDIMEDSGYGESLSVSKIPPTILEIVYQAILDDIHIEIIRTKGAQDAERVAMSALEEVRLKTSGSELFKYDGRKIVTDNLAKSIEANHISAKQIQTTYDVLTDRLLETVPHHKAKNFKGMIKVKSQEFAVDRATKLTKELARAEKILESINQMVAAMSASFNSHILEINEKLNQITENTLAGKASIDDVEALRNRFEETNERIMNLADDLALFRTEMEMKSTIREKEESEDEKILLTPGEEPFVASPEVPEGGMFAAQPSKPDGETPAPDARDGAILDAVAGGVSSKTAIIRETGLAEPVVAERLAALVGAKKVIEKKSGKRTMYSTLELEFGKLKEATSSIARGKKSEKKKKPELDAPVKEPAPQTEGPSVASPEVKQKRPGSIVLDDTPEPAPPAEKGAPDKVSRGPGVIVLDDTPEPEEPAPPKPEKKGKAKGKKAASKPKKAKPGKKDEKAASEPEKKVEPKPKKKAKPGKKEPEKSDEKEAASAATPSSEVQPEQGAGAERAHLDDIPVVKKSLSELSKEEQLVLDSVTEKGMTLSGIQSKAGKRLKRVELLRALRVLIDSGHVGISAKGRMELYQRINVTKMNKLKEKKNEKEVK